MSAEELDALPMPPIVRIEVNVSAVIQMPDGSIFGHNMVDATQAFGWRTAEPPVNASDSQVNAALTKAMSPVLALITTNLTLNGWIYIGQVEDDEPLAKSGIDTGLRSRSEPATVQVRFADERNAIHD
jgi:hypothetical protein